LHEREDAEIGPRIARKNVNRLMQFPARDKDGGEALNRAR